MAGSYSRSTELPPDEYLSKEEVLKLWGIVQDRIDSLMANGRDAVSNLTEDRNQEADAIDVASPEQPRACLQLPPAATNMGPAALVDLHEPSGQ